MIMKESVTHLKHTYLEHSLRSREVIHPRLKLNGHAVPDSAIVEKRVRRTTSALLRTFVIFETPPLGALVHAVPFLDQATLLLSRTRNNNRKAIKPSLDMSLMLWLSTVTRA